MDENLQTVLDRIQQQIADYAIYQKEVLNFNEACQYMGLSKSTLYKKTSQSEIPHYCPSGKLIFFKRSDLDSWMLKNRRSTTQEIEAEAMAKIQQTFKKGVKNESN